MTSAEQTYRLLTRYYDAFNAQDGEAMLSCLAEDVAHDINQGEREIGKDAFRAFLGRMEKAYLERLADITLMTNHDGSRASAEFVVHGKYLAADEGLPPAHGQGYQLPAGAFFEIKDNLVSRVTVYYNLADWIEQVSATNAAA